MLRLDNHRFAEKYDGKHQVRTVSRPIARVEIVDCAQSFEICVGRLKRAFAFIVELLEERVFDRKIKSRPIERKV